MQEMVNVGSVLVGPGAFATTGPVPLLPFLFGPLTLQMLYIVLFGNCHSRAH